jgi:hypothetical protein
MVLIALLPVRSWTAELPEVIEKIGKLNWYKTSAAEIEEILQTPHWEATVWDRLVELGMQARAIGIQQRFVKQVLEMERRGESDSERVEQLQLELQAEMPKLARADRAEQEFARFTDGLARLMDKRVVRLLGPFLFEQEDSTIMDDSRVLSTRDKAITTIAYMAHRGLSLPTTPPAAYGTPEDVEKWRQWWATNKEKFGEVLRLPPAIVLPSHGESETQKK